jgi:hypothetical protein
LINRKTIRSTAVFQGVSIAEHVTPTISGDHRRKSIAAIALVAILETGDGVPSIVAGGQAQFYGHSSGPTRHGHPIGDGAVSDGIYIASY